MKQIFKEPNIYLIMISSFFYCNVDCIFIISLVIAMFIPNYYNQLLIITLNHFSLVIPFIGLVQFLNYN